MEVILKKLNKIHLKYGEFLTRNERVMLVVVRQWFDVVLKQIRRDLSGSYFKKDVAGEFTDWNKIQREGMRIVKPGAMAVFASGGDVANKIFNVKEGFDVLTVDAVKQVDDICATLVREVSEETKKGIRAVIKQGIKDGKGMPAVARELRPIVGLTETQAQSIINYKKMLEEKHPEMSAKMRDYKTRQYASKTQTRRLNNIARTETANAQNAGYSQSMKEMGVEQLEFSATVGACKTCQRLNGKKYDVDEAGSIITGETHPSCRCAMLPVVGGKTISEPQKKPPSGLKMPERPEPKPARPPLKVKLPARAGKETIVGQKPKPGDIFPAHYDRSTNKIYAYDGVHADIPKLEKLGLSEQVFLSRAGEGVIEGGYINSAGKFFIDAKSALKDVSGKLRGELSSLKVGNKKLQSKIDGTKKEIGGLRVSNKKLQEGLEGKAKEIGSLKTELAGTKKKIKVLERQIEEFPS